MSTEESIVVTEEAVVAEDSNVVDEVPLNENENDDTNIELPPQVSDYWYMIYPLNIFYA
jgi:hypothetical protein